MAEHKEEPRKQRVTLKDISERTGFAISTISTVLNGHRSMGYVSQDTRELVWEVAEELGYPRARHARRPRLHQIGIFSPTGDIFHHALSQVCATLNEQGYRAITQVDSDLLHLTAYARELFRQYQIDGAIFIGSKRNAADLPPPEVPSVVIGVVPEGAQVNFVTVDQEAGGALVADHFWELGHRCVGVVTGGGGPHDLRLRGFRTAWLDRAGDLSSVRVITPPAPATYDCPDQAEFAAAVQALACDRGAAPLTALFCTDDFRAAWTIRALHQIGVSVPADVSVVGYDHSTWTDSYVPALTTVEQDFAELGASAARLLLRALQSGSTASHESHLHEPRLIVRESTAPPSR